MAATWCPQCNWPNSGYWWLWAAVMQLRGAQSSRQLFALTARCCSALQAAAYALLINGKWCISILSGTTQLLRWQGAQCRLRSVATPMGFPFGLIVTNPIDKRLIDLLSDCLVDLESWRRLRGTQGHRASERKAQSLYDDFSPKTRELKERGIRKNLKAADKKSDQIFQRRLRCEQKGSAYGSLCVSMSVCVCVSVWKSEWAPGLGSMRSLFRNWQS